MKGEEIMFDHYGSTAKKGMFLECIMWNNPCIAFKERTLYVFLGNAPYMYFQRTEHVFLFKEHTRTLCSRKISSNTCITVPSL
jgi:hypothetical protein